MNIDPWGLKVVTDENGKKHYQSEDVIVEAKRITIPKHNKSASSYGTKIIPTVRDNTESKKYTGGSNATGGYRANPGGSNTTSLPSAVVNNFADESGFTDHRKAVHAFANGDKLGGMYHAMAGIFKQMIFAYTIWDAVARPNSFESSNGSVADDAVITTKTVTAGAKEVVESGSTTVGRWMSKIEYADMLNSGKVQESFSGTTHVAYPSNINAFIKQAKPGSIYVEFEVPTSSLKVTNNTEGWAKILGPNTIEGRLARKKGEHIPQMPTAKNIKIIGNK